MGGQKNEFFYWFLDHYQTQIGNKIFLALQVIIKTCNVYNITNNGHQYQTPSSLFSPLPLYEVLLMCKRPYQSFERPAHWPCDRSMKLLSVKPPMTNLWISFFVVTGLFWSTISAELFFFFAGENVVVDVLEQK